MTTVRIKPQNAACHQPYNGYSRSFTKEYRKAAKTVQNGSPCCVVRKAFDIEYLKLVLGDLADDILAAQLGKSPGDGHEMKAEKIADVLLADGNLVISFIKLEKDFRDPGDGLVVGQVCHEMAEVDPLVDNVLGKVDGQLRVCADKIGIHELTR